MELNIELIKACVELNDAIKKAEEMVDRLNVPMLTNRSLLPKIHSFLSSKLSNAKNGYGVRAELFVLLYLYAPNRIVVEERGKNQKHNGLMYEIGGVMGISKGGLTRYRNSLMDYYKLYRPFRQLIDECLQDLEKNLNFS